jgi:hypothetical protein
VGLIAEFTDCLNPTPMPQDAEYTELIQNWAKEQDIDLTDYQMKRIECEAVAYMLPGFTFFTVFLIQWPVAYGPPDDLLGTNSIVAIDTNNGIELIPDENNLQLFY